MMAGRLIGLFLLILLAAVVSVKATVLCPFGGTWHYHNRTDTCVSLQTTESTYSDADESCKRFLGGSDKRTPGHLVYIFDKVTNDFVTALLNTSSAVQAYIGLIYNNSIYTWGVTQQNLGNYKGWADREPSSFWYMKSVVVTKSGWEAIDGGTKAEFVCQVNSVVDLPTISCPPAEVGQLGSITCTIELPNGQITLSEIRIKSDKGVEFVCSSQNCWRESRYKSSVGPYINLWRSTWNKEVQRSNDGSWTCSAKFSNNEEITSRPCYLQVYSLPSNIECETSHVKTTTSVTCTSTPWYPRAVCQWDIKTPNPFRKLPSYTSTDRAHEYNAEWQYYKMVCSMNVPQPVAGEYQFNLLMYPSVAGLNGTQLSTVKTKSVKFVVAAPINLPVLYDSQWKPFTSPFEVTARQIVTINCQISGGMPQVYGIVIECYSPNRQYANGSNVSVTLTITRDFHNESCRCYGYHLTGQTGATSLKFLVLSAPQITSFTIYGTQHQDYVQKNDLIFLTCHATGYPQYRLSLIYFQDTIKTLETEGKSYVTQRINATCYSMGNYSCVAENKAQQKDVKQVQLKVRCAPECCTGTEQLSKHGAAVGSSSTVQICVYVYPAPTSLWLFKGAGNGRRYVNSPRYKASFTYTNEAIGRGEISVTIFTVGQQDFGVYELDSTTRQSGYNNLNSCLRFELFPRGPPDCPKNLTVSSIFSDTITLSWTPGYNGGIHQSFTFLRYDSGVSTAAQNISVISEPAGNLGAAMSYNVTGLSGRTTYTFGLRAENDVGVSNCTLQVQASTDASPFSSDVQNVTVVAVPVILCLVLLIIVVTVVIVLVRRRRSRAVTKSDVAQSLRVQKMISSMNDGQDSSNANAIIGNRPAGQDISKVNNLTKGTTDDIGEDNTYALVIKDNNKKTQVEPRDKNIFRRDSDELKKDSTCALGKKPSSKKGKERSKDTNRAKKDIVEPQQDNTYAQVSKENKKKGKKQKSNESEEGNGAVLYSNMSNTVVYSNMSNTVNMKPSQAVAADESVYANMASSSKTGNEEQAPVIDDGRTVTDDGLIYTEVTINVKTTYPEIKGQARSKVAVLPKPVEPSVEYVALDFVASARQKF